MAVPFTVNATNAIVNSDGTYSSFQFNFPNNVDFTNQQLLVNSLVINNSWLNITERFQNNSFSIKWVDGTTAVVPIVDGIYSVDDLNLALQQFQIGKTWYTINNAGQSTETFNYYLQLAANPVYGKIQLSSVNVPTAAEAAAAGVTLPAGATWSFPLSDTNGQFIIPTFVKNNFGTSFSALLGFNPQTWPVSQSVGNNQSILSNFTPNFNPVAVVNILCDLIDNPYSSNNGQLLSFSVSGTPFGSNYDVMIPQDVWYQCKSGVASGFTIRVVDQTLNVPVLMNDIFGFNLQMSVKQEPPYQRDVKYKVNTR